MIRQAAGERLHMREGSCRASAYTVFFIVSVATHGALSPSTYTASNAPSSWTSIVRSTSSCGASRDGRRTLTSRTRDLP